MLKVQSIIPKTISRYCRKNTINSKYNRALDGAFATGLGVIVQTARIPHWEIQDIGITAMFTTLNIKCLKDAWKNRTNLSPIIKRAKNIKKAAKLNKNV